MWGNKIIWEYAKINQLNTWTIKPFNLPNSNFIKVLCGHPTFIRSFILPKKKKKTTNLNLRIEFYDAYREVQHKSRDRDILCLVPRWYTRCWKNFEKAKLKSLSFWDAMNTILEIIALLKISIFYKKEKSNLFFSFHSWNIVLGMFSSLFHSIFPLQLSSSPCTSFPSLFSIMNCHLH